MGVTLASVWRDGAKNIDRYQQQVKSLREQIDVDVVAVEGDSTDDTMLRLIMTDFEVLKVEHGGCKFDSVRHPLRWRQLSVACNAALCAAVRKNQDLVYVESDLLWDADTIIALLEHLNTVYAVAPMSFLHDGRFYDIFGHVKDGVEFQGEPPYHPELADVDGLVEVDSAGSCFAARADVLEFLEFSAFDCIRGIGRSLNRAGYALWLDPSLRVEQP